MLPLVIAGGIVGTGILAWLFGDSKDAELEAVKRGTERAARIYAPILDEMKENTIKIKRKYAFDKERFGGLIEEKACYIRKLESDLPRYKKAYEMKIQKELEQKNASKRTSVPCGALFSWWLNPPVIDYSDIMKREKKLKKLEEQGFENAKKMWEKSIYHHKVLLDKLKSEGDAESRNLIETYDDCMKIIIDFEKQIAYYQERVGDLG